LRSRLLEGLNDFASDVGAHGRTASENLLQRFQELAAFCVFQHVAGGACGEGFENVIRIFVNGEHDELRVRHERLQRGVGVA